MTDRQQVKALVFDVFGTVVDWRRAAIAELTAFGAEGHHRGLGAHDRRMARALSAVHGGGAIRQAAVDDP